MEKLTLSPLKSNLYLFLVFNIIIFNCNKHNSNIEIDHNTFVTGTDTIVSPSKITQLIIATCKEHKGFGGYLWGLELINEKWVISFDTIPCTFGKNGLAKENQKVEGDLKTPSGIFQIGSAFGYNKNIKTDINFIELSDHDYWVNDTLSNLYNTLVDFDIKGISAEKMRRNDQLYEYGIIVKYNTNPVIIGKGSAIFMHVERKKGSPTAGCIAVSRNNIINLIKWINPDRNTAILIGDREELDNLTKMYYN